MLRPFLLWNVMADHMPKLFAARRRDKGLNLFDPG